MKTLKKYFSMLVIRLGIVGELFLFLWKHKIWWGIPLIFLILLIMLLLFVGGSSGLAPFIYPLF